MPGASFMWECFVDGSRSFTSGYFLRAVAKAIEKEQMTAADHPLNRQQKNGGKSASNRKRQ